MTNLASTAVFEPCAGDPARTPTVEANDGRLRGPGSFAVRLLLPATVIMGELSGIRSPARAFPPSVQAEVGRAAFGAIPIPLEPDFEHALVPVDGESRLDGEAVSAGRLYYFGRGRREHSLASGRELARVLVLDAPPFAARPGAI